MAKIILGQVYSLPHLKHIHACPDATILTMVMKPYTIVTEDDEGIKTTIEPYHNLDFLTPTKPMVWGHKHYSGYPPLTDAQYTTQYRHLVMSNITQIEAWYQQLGTDDTVILCCYCAKGKFCHRRLVAKLFTWLNGKGIGGHNVVLDCPCDHEKLYPFIPEEER